MSMYETDLEYVMVEIEKMGVDTKHGSNGPQMKRKEKLQDALKLLIQVRPLIRELKES